MPRFSWREYMNLRMLTCVFLLFLSSQVALAASGCCRCAASVWVTDQNCHSGSCFGSVSVEQCSSTQRNSCAACLHIKLSCCGQQIPTSTAGDPLSCGLCQAPVKAGVQRDSLEIPGAPAGNCLSSQTGTEALSSTTKQASSNRK